MLYQILMALALPAFLLHALWRGGWTALRQRLGLGPKPDSTPRLWLHGASLGEVTSARWVIDALLAERPGMHILVTTNSMSGRAMVAGWGLTGVDSALAPLDAGGAAGRLLDRVLPQALVIIENELWPARIAAARRRGVPVLVIGARMSERSARRWRLWPGLIGTTLARIDWLSAQDDVSAMRFAALGLPLRARGPTLALKSLAAPEVRPAPFARPVERASCLLAASTHEGEEKLVLAAFTAARAKGGPQFLILAPRHPRRGDAIAKEIGQTGLAFVRWSKAEVPGAETAVLLADTLGEMPHWYAMSGTCIIGGTFAPKGGHTPFDPAHFGCAMIHGPSVTNFAAQFAALDQGGGAIALSSAKDLTEALQGLSAPGQARLAAAANACLARFSDGASEVTTRLLQALPLSLRLGPQGAPGHPNQHPTRKL